MFEDVDEGHAEGEEPVVFRYNREERIKNAPQIVKDYYDGKMAPVRGIRILWVNKSNRFILLSLVIFIAFIWTYSGLNNTRAYGKIKNINFKMQAFSYDEEIFVNIKLFSKTADEKSKPEKIDAEIYFINNDNQIIQKDYQSIVYRNGDQYIRTKYTDYDIIRVDVVITVDDNKKELSSGIKR